MFTVIVKKSVLKGIEKIPKNIQFIFDTLINDLKDKGPIRTEWPNFSKLGNNKYHCHLAYKWVACWYNKKNSIVIEVYYAGSRENAPY